MPNITGATVHATTCQEYVTAGAHLDEAALRGGNERRDRRRRRPRRKADVVQQRRRAHAAGRARHAQFEGRFCDEAEAGELAERVAEVRGRLAQQLGQLALQDALLSAARDYLQRHLQLRVSDQMPLL